RQLISVPFLDDELRLRLDGAIADLELQVLGADALFEAQRRTAAIIARVRPPAAEQGYELMLAGLQVADVEAVHAALEQGLRLALRIEIAGHFLVVDIERHGVEREKLAHVHRHEYSELGVRRKQQLLLEHEQLAIQIEHFLLERLHLLIDAAELGPILGLRGVADWGGPIRGRLLTPEPQGELLRLSDSRRPARRQHAHSQQRQYSQHGRARKIRIACSHFAPRSLVEQLAQLLRIALLVAQLV